MPKRRHQPVRTCIACRQEAGKAALIRIVRGPDGGAHVDPTGHAPGRGAYLHRDAACIQTARKRRQLERALGAAVAQELWAELTPPP
ncbi:MAG TPA: YlxR family protein [Candidatus Dormibacteraeota bacterium]|nr:YlxR family protein [Candidatus Dormibacteraeota bacterium]